MKPGFLGYINALLLREIHTRLGNNPLSLLWVVVEPIANVIVFLGIKIALGLGLVHGIHNALYVIAGIVPFFAFSNAWAKVQTGPKSNVALLAFPNIKTFHVIASRFLFEYIIMGLVTALLLSIAYMSGFTFSIHSLLGVFFNYTLLVLLGAGVGMVIAPLAGRFHFVETLSAATRRILFFTSGVFFSLDFLPYHIQEIMALNPVGQLISLLRVSLFYNYIPNPLYLNEALAVGFTALVLFIGLAMMKRYERWAYETN